MLIKSSLALLFLVAAAGAPKDAPASAPATSQAAATGPAKKLPASTPYALRGAIPLAADGHWAKPTLTSDGKRLYILEVGKTQVIDVATGKPISEFPSASGPRNMLILPAANRAFITNGWGKSVTLVDLKTNTPLGNILINQDADSILYDPHSQRVFTSSWAERCLVSYAPDVDVKNPKLATPIKFDGRPTSIVADDQGMIYVATIDPNAIDVVDTRTMHMAASWLLDETPSSLAMDRVHSRLFVATPGGILVVSATDGRVLTKIPIKSGTRQVTFADDKIFAQSNDASLHIISMDAAGQFHPQQTLTAAALHTPPNPDNSFAVDPVTGTIYLPQVEPHDISWQTRPLKLLVVAPESPKQ